MFASRSASRVGGTTFNFLFKHNAKTNYEYSI